MEEQRQNFWLRRFTCSQVYSLVILCLQEADISTRLEDVGPEDIESSETAECVTMVDVLQDENDLEEDAR